MMCTNTPDETPTPLARRVANAVVVATLAFVPLTLTACNTVEGAGEDIRAGGEAIDDAAEDAN